MPELINIVPHLLWNGKDKWENPEPRLLIEKKVYQGEKKGLDDNLIIYGDNLPGLKTLEKDYTGKVKCIYIDPPYNTKSCFTHYNDNLEHSLWLNMMKERLVIMHKLIREDGSIWISIDDSECHYLKVMCDEIFGRKNFISCVTWQHSIQVKGYKTIFSLSHNYILSYKKSEKFVLNSLCRESKDNIQYNNPDNDPKGPWCRGPVANSLFRPNLKYKVQTPSGKMLVPPEKGWRWCRETLAKKIEQREVCFNESETTMFRKIYLSEQDGKSPSTIWFPDDVGSTREANKEIQALIPDNVFDTPKPERLIHRILHLATNPGDLVLDSFAGSGTTGAVAHKMGRKWIMIEFNDSCHSHIIPRMEKVINGEDPGGVTKVCEWKGGGGFRYCEMAYL